MREIEVEIFVVKELVNGVTCFIEKKIINIHRLTKSERMHPLLNMYLSDYFMKGCQM